MCLDSRPHPDLSQEIAVIVSRLPLRDAAAMHRAIRALGGRRELQELLQGVYRLSPGVRTALVERLNEAPVLRVLLSNDE